MSSSDRVQKFFDDQAKVLVSSSKPGKISAEIDKLRTWLIKHQDEVLPDSAKTKLLSVMEKYNRAQAYFTDVRGAVQSLFEAYLQMPEGKLVSSSNKNKVLTWLQNMASSDDADSADNHSSSRSVTSSWTVESIDEAKGTASLVSTANPDEWREDFPVGKDILQEWAVHFGGEESIVVELDEASNQIASFQLVQS